ncbi:hypothetical protein BDP27DRAFT_1406544 [Rhodocollybia butyracea]|uniref:Uncharacterized protein n=1 Tax=Rhodocollybia butyracea TaxID=206335 RepID=A0A9P5PE31_9AGAR|nr:hypothetical protein BDP27DRAFT_1406544 [Rhodocollybia butyracea]
MNKLHDIRWGCQDNSTGANNTEKRASDERAEAKADMMLVQRSSPRGGLQVPDMTKVAGEDTFCDGIGIVEERARTMTESLELSGKPWVLVHRCFEYRNGWWPRGAAPDADSNAIAVVLLVMVMVQSHGLYDCDANATTVLYVSINVQQSFTESRTDRDKKLILALKYKRLHFTSSEIFFVLSHQAFSASASGLNIQYFNTNPWSPKFTRTAMDVQWARSGTQHLVLIFQGKSVKMNLVDPTLALSLGSDHQCNNSRGPY